MLKNYFGPYVVNDNKINNYMARTKYRFCLTRRNRFLHARKFKRNGFLGLTIS